MLFALQHHPIRVPHHGVEREHWLISGNSVWRSMLIMSAWACFLMWGERIWTTIPQYQSSDLCYSHYLPRTTPPFNCPAQQSSAHRIRLTTLMIRDPCGCIKHHNKEHLPVLRGLILLDHWFLVTCLGVKEELGRREVIRGFSGSSWIITLSTYARFNVLSVQVGEMQAGYHIPSSSNRSYT